MRLVTNVAVVLVLAIAGPAAAAHEEPLVAGAETTLWTILDDLRAAVDGLWTHPEDDPGDAGHDAHASEDAGASDEPSDDGAHDAPPTYRDDPLGAPLLSEAPTLVLKPARDAARGVPLVGGVADGLLGELLGDDRATEDADASAPLAPASAAPAPATDLPPEAQAAGVALAVVAAAGAAGAASGLGALGLEKLRRLGGLAGLALYTRLARTELLDHGVRDRIYAAIKERPGVTLQELAEAGGVGRTAAAYHLRVLGREGLVASRRDGRVRRFHANGHQLDAAEKLAALGHPSGRALADVVTAEPGLDQSTLAERLGLSSSLAHWHLKRLEAAGVVAKSRDGRKVRYYPTAAAQ